MTFTPSITLQLPDQTAERVRRNTAQQIGELQGMPSSSLRVAATVTLTPGVPQQIAHKLGRAPRGVWTGCPRAASTLTAVGTVQEFRGKDPSGNPIDATQIVVLEAIGFGGVPITVEVMVF